MGFPLDLRQKVSLLSGVSVLRVALLALTRPALADWRIDVA